MSDCQIHKLVGVIKQNFDDGSVDTVVKKIL